MRLFLPDPIVYLRLPDNAFFHARSKFHMLQHGVERVPVMMATADQLEWSRCTGSPVLGLQACAEIAIPRPFANSAAAWFPLSGPAHAKVYINKVDTHTGYHIEAR